MPVPAGCWVPPKARFGQLGPQLVDHRPGRVLVQLMTSRRIENMGATFDPIQLAECLSGVMGEVSVVSSVYGEDKFALERVWEL